VTRTKDLIAIQAFKVAWLRMSGNAGDQNYRGKMAEKLASEYLESVGCEITARYRRGTADKPIYDFDVRCPNDIGQPVKRIEVKEAKIKVKEKTRGKDSTRGGRFVMKPHEERDCYAFLVDDFYNNSVTLDFIQADAVDPLYPHQGASPKLNIGKIPEIRKFKCFDWLENTIILPRTTLGRDVQ